MVDKTALECKQPRYHSKDHDELWTEAAAGRIITEKSNIETDAVDAVNSLCFDKVAWKQSEDEASDCESKDDEINAIEHGISPPFVHSVQQTIGSRCKQHLQSAHRKKNSIYIIGNKNAEKPVIVQYIIINIIIMTDYDNYYDNNHGYKSS